MTCARPPRFGRGRMARLHAGAIADFQPSDDLLEQIEVDGQSVLELPLVGMNELPLEALHAMAQLTREKVNLAQRKIEFHGILCFSAAGKLADANPIDGARHDRLADGVSNVGASRGLTISIFEIFEVST